MKIKRLVVLAVIPFFLLSCEDEPSSYTSIKVLENLVYLSVKDYRIDNGLDGPFVHQLILVREAQIYSYKMAKGVEEVGTQGLAEHWRAANEKYTFYNQDALVLKSDSYNEDQILTQLLLLPDADSILLGDLTQCGVGIETDTAGYNYITIMLAKADS